MAGGRGLVLPWLLSTVHLHVASAETKGEEKEEKLGAGSCKCAFATRFVLRGEWRGSAFIFSLIA